MINRIRVLRAERRMSQAELAEMVDVSRQTINAIEVGKHDPSLPLAMRIARTFGQPVEKIFSDEAPETDGVAEQDSPHPETFRHLPKSR